MISTKKWIVIIAAIFIAALAGTVLTLTGGNKGTVAQIVQDGTVIYTIDLSDVDDTEYITVEYEGRTNTILIQPGRICVSDADCPDGVCVDTGWIPSGEKSIVCLPNHLVIRIVNADANIDAEAS